MISPTSSVQGNLYLKSDKNQTKKVFDNTKPSAVSASYVFVRPNYGTSQAQTDTEKPVIKNATVSNITDKGFDVSCIATDNVGVDRVYFPTWTKNNGQDDIIWHEGKYIGGRWSCHIDTLQHKVETGTYITHVYAYDKAGNQAMQGIGEVLVGVYPNDIKMGQSNIDLYVGDTATLTATVYPSNAVDKTVKWSSDNTSIVTVNNGRIKAVAPGTTIVKAKLASIPMNGNGTSTCTVTVKEKAKPAVNVTEEKKEPVVSADENKENPVFDVKEEEKQNPTVEEKETSDDNTDANQGSKTTDDSSTKEAVWEYAKRADVTMDTHSLQMNIGETATLDATVVPANAVKDRLKWTSSDTSVVTVENGIVKAVGAGTATVKASIGYVPPEGKWQDECKITITKNNDIPVTGIRITTKPSVYEVGDIKYLSIEFTPADATNKWAKWSSSNTDVAVIVDGGWLTCLGPGETTISITTKDGGYTDSFNLRVVDNSNDVSGSKQEAAVYENSNNNSSSFSQSDNAGLTLRNGKYKAPGIAKIDNIYHSGSVIEEYDVGNQYFRASDGTYRSFGNGNMYVITVTSETSYTYEVKSADGSIRKLRLYYSYID